MEKTDTFLYYYLAVIILGVAGFIGYVIGQDQMQNEAILTKNAHWETLANGHTLFKWNNL